MPVLERIKVVVLVLVAFRNVSKIMRNWDLLLLLFILLLRFRSPIWYLLASIRILPLTHSTIQQRFVFKGFCANVAENLSAILAMDSNVAVVPG